MLPEKPIPEKSISDKQREANRRNAQHSTGPRTEQGKLASRLNAFRHGLTGQVTIMSAEERLVHDQFFGEYVDSLKPATPVERDLAEAVADNAWRLKRARALDQNMFAAAHPEFTGQSEEDEPMTTVLAEAKAFLV